MSEAEDKSGNLGEQGQHHHSPHHPMHSAQQLPHQPHPQPTSSSSGSPTLSGNDEEEEHLDKIPENEAPKADDSHHQSNYLHSTLESHKHNTHAFDRASDVESLRHSLYPVTSYASQIGGEGGIEDGEVERPAGEKDPNLVEWDGPDDKNNPYNWSSAYKWWITFQVSVMTLCVAFTSSVFTAGIPDVARDLGTTEVIATLGVTTYVLGFAFGPLVWAPMSEARGRRPVYLISWSVFTIFQIPCALAKNSTTLIVARLIAGTFGSSPLANAGGSLADIWLPHERGKAMSLFAAAPFLGPVLGPIVGGFLSQYVSWRWTFWLSLIYASVIMLDLVFLVPETYTKALLEAKARKLRKETGNEKLRAASEINKQSMVELYRVSLLRPWRMFCEPIVLLFSIYVAILYGILYLLFVAFPIIFEEQRGWGAGIGGLPFIGIGVGSCIGVALTPVINRNYLSQMEKHANGSLVWPEARLPPTFIGAFLMPIALFWFAWTSYPSLHWIGTVLAGVPFGLAQILLFLSIMNYLADCYLQYAASALAANSLLRSVLGATFPLWAPYMYRALGTEWATSILGFAALTMVPIPFAFYKWGPQIRTRSKWAQVL